MILPLACAAGLAAIHLLADRLRVAKAMPRSAWLSAASGASVAFVFLLLMPELAARQRDLNDLELFGFLNHHLWFAALLGLAAFYAAEHWMLTHGAEREEVAHGAFWAHIGIFALYNVVIGYILFDPHPAVVDHVLPYAFALAFHLLVIDDAMRRHHPVRYHRVGRWALAAAVLIGASAGMVVSLHAAVPAVALAVLAGGIVLNALKDELPDEREGRVWPFLAGATSFALFVVVVGAL